MSTREGIGRNHAVKETCDELDFFTDRHHAVRLFANVLNEDRAGENSSLDRIIFFYGDGGNGKTMLLRFLRERCCKKLSQENWSYVKELADVEFVSNLTNAEGARAIPSAFVDFHHRPVTFLDGASQEAPTALRMLRQDLMNYGFRFPLFDFTYIWYLHKGLNLSGNMIKSLMPTQDLMANFIDVVTGTSYASLINATIGLFGPKLDLSFTIFAHKWKIDRDQFEDISRLDPRTQLIDRLPEVFSQDLNTAMRAEGAPERVVLFFDTHEAFWKAGDRESDPYFYRDEWFRILLKSLDRRSRIKVVIAGREPPRWPKASKAAIGEEDLVFSLIGHLSYEDASSFLQRTGIVDVPMQHALIEYASVSAREIHPLLLRMCAEVVHAAIDKKIPIEPSNFHTHLHSSMRIPELLATLLKYVDVNLEYAIRALSACRAFTQDIYIILGRELGFQSTLPNFHVLRSFSFVWEGSRQGWLHIHLLVRRLLRERPDEVIRQADEVMEKYYRERARAGEELAKVEAIYHANHLDWKRAVDEWVEVFESALESGRYDLCHALQEIRNELDVKTDFTYGKVCLTEGDYFANLSRHDEAIKTYVEAIDAFDRAMGNVPDQIGAQNKKGLALAKLGDVQATLAKNNKAIESYKKAVDACEATLKLDSSFFEAYNNKGWALSSLGDVQAGRSLHKEAIQSYREATNAFDEIPADAHDYADAQINKAKALGSLGEVEAELSHYDEAGEIYRRAIAACEQPVKSDGDDVTARVNKIWILSCVGDMEAQRARYDEAIQTLEKAITEGEDLLEIAPEDVIGHVNKGHASINLADVLFELSRRKEATCWYKKGIMHFEKALQSAPHDVIAHNNKGLAFTSLGDIQSEVAHYEKAIKSYEQATASLEEALLHASGDITVRINMANALESIGDLQTDLSDYKAAFASYEQALDSCQRVLDEAQDDVSANISKGYALASLAELQTKGSQHREAFKNYRASIAAYKKAVKVAPNSSHAYITKGSALSCVGELFFKLKKHQKANYFCQQAIVSLDHALGIAPDNILALKEKTISLRRLAPARSRPSQSDEAYHDCEQAVDLCGKALARAPADIIIHINKGDALRTLGSLQAESPRYLGKAIKNFRQSINAFDKALELAPRNVSCHNSKGIALLELGRLQAARLQTKKARISLRLAVKEFCRSLEIAKNDRSVRDLRDQAESVLNDLKPL